MRLSHSRPTLRHLIPYFYGLDFLAISFCTLGAKLIWQRDNHVFLGELVSIAIFLGLYSHPVSSGHIFALPD